MVWTATGPGSPPTGGPGNASSPAAARIDTRPANDATWTAAGKAFGHLQATDGAGGARVRPDAYHMVLPAFHAVRLIPVDAASGSNQGAYDLDWRRHARDHLPAYLQYGGAGLEADCWYCRQLETWDDPAFRQTGIDWLNDTNNVCDRGTSGPGYGGGTRRGH